MFSFNSDEDRERFAENIAAHLEKDGRWVTIVGNADDESNL
jgi:hypothetical protein